MIRNYIKITGRHLWRHRLFTVLNIVGLSIGLCVSFVVFRLVDYELSYDRELPNPTPYVQLAVKTLSNGQESGVTAVAMGLAPIIENEGTGVESVIPMYYREYNHAHSARADQPKESLGRQVATLPAYFEMVSYRWLAGTPSTALRDQHDVVLTRSRASHYYPQLTPTDLLGKNITYNDSITKTITGIVEDIVYNTSFDAEEFFLIDKAEWPNDLEFGYRNHCLLFLKLHEGVSKESVLSQINNINNKDNSDYFERFQSKYWYEFIPVADRHFASNYHSPYHRTANKNVLYGLVGIAAFLLILAIINYVNLSTAILPQRAKEIGIRKTLGGRSRQLILRFMGETLCVTLLALLLSYLMHTAVISLFEDYFPTGIRSYFDYPRMVFFLVVLILLITLISSVYPSWLLTKVNTVTVLKGRVDNGQQGRGLTFRRSLIVFQFFIAQVFIIGALIVGLQLRYTLHKDMGFTKEAIVTMDIPIVNQTNDTALTKQLVLKQALLKHPEVAAVALGDIPMGVGAFSSVSQYNGPSGIVHVDLLLKTIDEDWIDLYEVKLIAGRQPAVGNNNHEIIINESAVNAYGFESTEEALGKAVGSGDHMQRIVGVVGDFHLFNFKSENRPVRIVVSEPRVAQQISVKLHGQLAASWSNAIEKMAKDWISIYPETPFSYHFYDETIERMYMDERRMAKVINYATAVTIVISCLGLFGLVTLMAYQRTKEIGIRKVLGASISSILTLFSKEFIKLVLIATLIASPVAWWGMNKWLADFAYRIEVQWWMFAVAGLAAVVIALLTVSGQAIRAAVANPVESLRDE